MNLTYEFSSYIKMEGLYKVTYIKIGFEDFIKFVLKLQTFSVILCSEGDLLGGY
jgi:hypothetical protein